LFGFILLLLCNKSNGNGVAVTGNTAINDGKWHHIVVVRDESTNKNRLYVDAVEEDWATYDYGAGFDATKTHYYLARGYCDTCDSPVRIMPLGDSITHGTYGHGDPRTDDYVTGYRQPLYLSLTDAGYDVDFVGSLQTGQSATPSFDYDHEGHGGWTDSQVASHVYDWLVTNPAEVVLLHIGTNGINASPNDVEDILDEIDRYEADYDMDITVLLARIINRISYSQTTTDFNDNVEAMAELRIAAGDRIIIVDMENGAGLVYTQDTTPPYDDGDMYDNLHPNDDGYDKMANVWLNGDSDGSDSLVDFLPICAPPTPVAPTITSTPVTEATVGWPYSYDVDATGYPAPTYALTTSPAGMTIDENTGVIAWTPTATGDYDVTVEASNSEGSAIQPFTINVAAAPVCPADMISYWKLDETGTPTTFEDFYGDNDGTCSGGTCPTPATGILGGAQDFDGGDQVDVPAPDPDVFDFAADESFSIGYWVNTTQSCSSAKVYIARRDADFWLGCGQVGSIGVAKFSLSGSGGGNTLTGSSQINDGDWHFIVVGREAGAGADTQFLYVDGVLEDSGTTTDFGDIAGSQKVTFGYYNVSPYYYYDGMLDEIAFFRRALPLAEVQQYYNNGLAGFGYCEAPPEPGILGDVNGDDTVNSTDALIILSCNAGIDTSQFCPMNCGDVNADGLVNSTDALIILSYDVGIYVPYPVGQPGCPSSVTPCPGCTP
jgi:lysophospholipase L1-like esterase